MSEEKEFDLNTDLRAAMGDTYDAMNKERAEPSAASPSAEVEQAVSSPADATETPAEKPRGPDGKFVAKDKAEPAKVETEQQAAPEKVEQPEQTTDQAVQTGGIKPPPGWSAAAKAEFPKLPLAVQEAIAKREIEVSSGFKQYGEKTKAYEAIDNVLKPILPALQMQGLDPAQYVKNLMSAETALRGPNKEQAFLWLAGQYGIDVTRLAPAPKQELDPAIAPLHQEVTQLKQLLTAQQQAHQQALQAEIQTELSRFAADPKNEFFEQVREDMGALISSGRASGLADAYDKACRMNPDVFQIIEARKLDALNKSRVQQSVQKATQAKAVTNVQGTANTPGAVPSMRDGMAAVYERMQAGA